MIRGITRALYVFIAIALAFFIFLITPYGFHTSLNLLKKSLPGKLSYQKISGTIFGPIHVTNLMYDTKQYHVSASKIHLEWHLSMLLIKTLSISNLTMNHVSIQFKHQNFPANKNSKKAQSKLLTLPLSIKIKKSEIHDIKFINQDGKLNASIKKLSAKKVMLSKQKISGHMIASFNKPSQLKTEIQLSGKLSDYFISWYIERKNNKLILTAQGNTQGVNLTIYKNQASKGNAIGTAHIHWHPYLSWNTNIHVSSLDLSQFYQSLPMINYASVKSTGFWKNEISLFDVDADIKAPGANILIKGSHKKQWLLKYNIDIKNLTLLFPSYSGSVSSTGSITGTHLSPRITGKINATHFHKGALRAKKLSGNYDIDFSFLQNGYITLEGNNIILPFAHANQLKFKANITQHLQNVTLDLNAALRKKQNLRLNVNLNGKIQNQTWQGELTHFSFYGTTLQQWQIASPSKLLISPQKISLAPACWRRASEKFCLSFDWNKMKTWSISANGDTNALTLLSAFLLPNITINAPGSFNAKIDGNNTIISNIQSHVQIQNGSITYSNNGKSYPIKKLILAVSSKKNDLIAQINAHFSQADSFNTHLVFPNFIKTLQTNTVSTSQVNGDLHFNFSSMNLFQLFTPLISKPKGKLLGNLSISGRLPLPDLSGKITFEEGVLEIPELKITLHDISATVHAKNKVITYEIVAKTDGSSLVGKGNTKYQHDKLISTLSVDGNEILIANTAEYYVLASPHLTLKHVGQGMVLSGNIEVPKATLKPITFSSTVSLPEDTVIISQESQEQQPRINWFMNVTVTLGKDVTIASKGLQAQLKGKLQISRSPTKPTPIATGQIALINGTFTTHGKTLTIVDGSNVNYTHDIISNPHLSIKAQRDVTVISNRPGFELGPTKTAVGFNIEGNLHHPRVSLFSTPVQLSQADILSYLLFNTGASGNSSQNLATILGAVSSLNINSGNQDSSISSIKQKLGITELGVEEQTYVDLFGTPLGVDQSSFVIGSYITPNIYVRYNRGLLNSFNIYTVRYIFNKHWAIQSETETGFQSGTGVDVLYTISRKKFPR